MSDDLIDDEFERHELEYENVMASLNSVASLEQSVVASKKVDRMTMESLHRLFPETVDKNYPLATFTSEPSEQNYDIALESFSVAKAVAVAAIGGLLGTILYKLISAFRSNKVDVRSEFLDKKQKTIKDNDRTMKKTLARVKKLDLSPEEQIVVDAIESWNVEFFMGESKPASKSAEDFITAVTRGGNVYRIMDRWSSDIVKYTSEFKKRVRLMAEVVDVMYEVRGNDIAALQSKAESIVLNSKDKFLKDMGELDMFFRTLDLGESFVTFINEQVAGTQEFHDVIGNSDLLLSSDKLYSNSSAQIEKNLNEIEKKYAPVLSGGAKDTSLKKAKAAARAKSTSGSQDAAALGMINPFLLKAIDAAQESLVREASQLRMYVVNLERVLYFYQKAVVERDKIENEATLKLTEIENRGR